MAHGTTPEERLGRVVAKMRFHIDESQRLAALAVEITNEVLVEGHVLDWRAVRSTYDARLSDISANRGAEAARAGGPVADDA